MKKIAVFISGGGSNFQSLIDACKEGKINGKIVLCIASKGDAFGLVRAKNHGIESAVFFKSDYGSLHEMYEKMIKLLAQKEVDLIVLAGYLTILTPNIVQKYKNAIINIHPSLIPKYCGKGFYGLKVHQAVIDAGEKESGATVHFVDEGTDTGAIIMQKTVPVLKGDTAETLQTRVLEIEHELLVEAVAEICSGKPEQK